LDLGAITPEEIAVSIMAEIVGLRRRVERPLPHLSWFHSSKRTAADVGEAAHDAVCHDESASVG
jgi:hypothetical protein